jgi:hypothetical protein
VNLGAACAGPLLRFGNKCSPEQDAFCTVGWCEDGKIPTAGGPQECLAPGSGAEDSQLWELCVGLLPLSLQGQEPSGGKGLGGPEHKVKPGQGHLRRSPRG